jgi:hypothetical protein
MKKIILIFSFLFSFVQLKSQTSLFNEDSDVITFMDGKTFFNSDNGLEIEYGYISSYNTYGIKVLNKNGARFYFINVNITCYGSSADLFGMSEEDGGNFGFRLYKNKLVVGKGEPGEQTFYLK